jgi:FSR family fosmidomycin resistance protein-like MFS transporter
MMNRATMLLVLLVSCAHALVHTYEQALPSVEQRIAAEFFADDPAAGKAMTGHLSNVWRLMWGLGGILAGGLVDYLGGRRMLSLFLIGCAATCGLAAGSGSRAGLFAAMLWMGAFASIYHPAGLTLISHETNPANRARAQGIHGVFGSAGIGLAPLFVGLMFAQSATWRQVYWVLMVPGLALGLVFAVQSIRHAIPSPAPNPAPPIGDDPVHAAWRSFGVLTLIAAMQGFVYSAVTSFLPRYLAGGLSESAAGLRDAQANYLAAAVLFIGCVGQYGAGRFARHSLLERQIMWICLGNVPFLAWMAVAVGWHRVAAAGLLTLVHFMHQPIYNTLIAKYTPRRRRGVFYGLSFAMGQGVGSFGAGFAGSTQNDTLVYGALAAVATLAGFVAALLCHCAALEDRSGQLPETREPLRE